MIDKEFEESLLELRDVLCDERIAEYCIENGIAWSDSAMTGSPVEIILLAKELIEYGMTEKLGVLLVDVPNSWYRYIFLMESTEKKLTIWETDDKEVVIEVAFKCTRKEAEQFPRFEWVSLEEL